jgi:hypothetical protein
VSGLPRSGTSLMMAMLEAGGLELLTDHHRPPDDDNPNGYFEYQPVAATRSDASWLGEASGKVVKVIHALLPDLPDDRRYRVIFMTRAIAEIVASQQTMLERHGQRGAGVAAQRLIDVFDTQLATTLAWLRQQAHVRLLEVSYNALIASPLTQALRISAFLDERPDPRALAAVVDARLYRHQS